MELRLCVRVLAHMVVPVPGLAGQEPLAMRVGVSQLAVRIPFTPAHPAGSGPKPWATLDTN